MRVLLDEDLPHDLRLLLPDHEVATTYFQGWTGLKNGMLLRATEDAGFDVLLTGDKKMQSQQNMSGRKLSVIVLCQQKFDQIVPHLDKIRRAIDKSVPGIVETIDWR